MEGWLAGGVLHIVLAIVAALAGTGLNDTPANSRRVFDLSGGRTREAVQPTGLGVMTNPAFSATGRRTPIQ